MENDFYNVAVFIDYENIYKTLLFQRKNLLREGFFEKFRIWCKEHNRRIIKIVAYCNFDNEDLYNSYHQTRLQAYGIDTIHTSNKGKNFADLQITIDVLNNMYLNKNIDEFIIMSNDKDMTPLLNTIKVNKRKVTLITAADCFDNLIINFPDEHIRLEDILATECKKLLIEDIQDEVLKNMNNYFERIINNNFTDYSFDYNVANNAKYFKIMEYEVANIFNILHDKKEIFFYNYNYRGKTVLALAPISFKQNMIDNKAISKEQILEEYNSNDLVDKKYSEYVSKSHLDNLKKV